MNPLAWLGIIVALVPIQSSEPPRALRLADVIARWDDDGNGKLSTDELPCPTDSDGNCDAISWMLTVESYDPNADGWITAEEFDAVQIRAAIQTERDKLEVRKN